jgi:alpha-L-fucosidase 2
MNPPWSSDYHLNINLQMNYMAAETVNLANVRCLCLP